MFVVREERKYSFEGCRIGSSSALMLFWDEGLECLAAKPGEEKRKSYMAFGIALDLYK